MISHFEKRVVITGGLSVAAGIHLAVAAAHDLGTVHGAFFAATAVLQAGLAVASARRLTGLVAASASASSAVLLVIWFVERLARVGSENPGILDTVASASELLVIVACASAFALRAPRAANALPRVGVIAVVVIVTTLASAAAPAEHAHHRGGTEHEHPASAPARSHFDELLLHHHEPAPGTHDH